MRPDKCKYTAAFPVPLALALFSCVASIPCFAQNAPADQSAPPAAAPAAPAALTTPAMTGPLSQLPPAVFEAGPFGKISVNGILDGMGMWTGNYVPGDNATQAALSNGQIFIQKTDGWFQFFL